MTKRNRTQAKPEAPEKTEDETLKPSEASPAEDPKLSAEAEGAKEPEAELEEVEVAEIEKPDPETSEPSGEPKDEDGAAAASADFEEPKLSDEAAAAMLLTEIEDLTNRMEHWFMVERGNWGIREVKQRIAKLREILF